MTLDVMFGCVAAVNNVEYVQWHLLLMVHLS